MCAWTLSSWPHSCGIKSFRPQEQCKILTLSHNTPFKSSNDDIFLKPQSSLTWTYVNTPTSRPLCMSMLSKSWFLMPDIMFWNMKFDIWNIRIERLFQERNYRRIICIKDTGSLGYRGPDVCKKKICKMLSTISLKSLGLPNKRERIEQDWNFYSVTLKICNVFRAIKGQRDDVWYVPKF